MADMQCSMQVYHQSATTMNKTPSLKMDFKIDFEKFCKDSYGNKDIFSSDTFTKATIERIISVLKGKPTPELMQDPFYVWIKKRGFALTSYPHLGLKEALCIRINSQDSEGGWKRVAFIEDFYNVITQFHGVEHVDALRTFEKIKEEHEGVPYSAVNKYVEICPICCAKESHDVIQPPVTNHDQNNNHVKVKRNNFMNKAQIEVIELHDKPFGSFPLICFYIDLYSNYHIIFPVPQSNLQMNIALKLRRCVFPYFGVPRYLCSSKGANFIDSIIEASCLHWPDAAAIHNGSNKVERMPSVIKRAKKSEAMIGDLFESCRNELENIQLTSSSCADLLLSLQYQLNTTSTKNSRKSAHEIVFGISPHATQMTQEPSTSTTSSDETTSADDIINNDEEWTSDLSSNKHKKNISTTNKAKHAINRNCQVVDEGNMNRLMQKSSSPSQASSQKLQQMLSLSSIQAQEQQVTSLRELLRQEEGRLEMLKKMRGPSSSGNKQQKVLKESSQKNAVIRSTEIGRHLTNGSQPPISSRLQQIVDSVAVDQINSKYNIADTKYLNSNSFDTKHMQSTSPEVITLTDTPSPVSPPALISANTGVIQEPTKPLLAMDEGVIMRSVESSRRYRDFIVKQNNMKRNFQKQIDRKLSEFSYPKTFRQVWPIIPVQDPSFVKNLGLECVTQFFDRGNGSQTKQSSSSKVKPVCNQCGWDFASAWQIRKNNSKQVLLCESCDFTNLKLLQRTKLSNQLNEIIENVQKEEEKFETDCEETKKQIVTVERQSLISNAHRSYNTNNKQFSHKSSEHVVIPSILASKNSSEFKSLDSGGRKRVSDQNEATVPRKATKTSASPQVDHTLNRITQQLLRKQVDEKVQQRRHPNTTTITTTTTTTKKQSLQPLINEGAVVTANNNKPVPEMTTSSTPPPLISSGGESRKNRRKGQPRQNRQLNSVDINF